MSVCPNCGDKCCNWVDCYYKDWKAQLIPQEYEWVCPKCKTTNFIIGKTYPETSKCSDCDETVELILTDCQKKEMS